MARWEADARGRLAQAAMELFEERGYAGATVEDIAARAGLTERTFFRYFADKREVLFPGFTSIERRILDTIEVAVVSTPPLTAVTAALEALTPMFAAHRAYSLKRRTIITAHTELRERELIKLLTLSTAIAAKLRARGLAAPAAALIAETGIAIFNNAFERWVEDAGQQDFAMQVRAAVKELQAATTAMELRRPRSTMQR